jgi:endonuclease/exonuclease/phosphatase (EEP) superfamily protein YafD
VTLPQRPSIRRIDYLYVDRAVRCANAEVLETDASDHRPLLVQLIMEQRSR